MAASALHAGCGQLCFGTAAQRKADLCLAMPGPEENQSRLAFFNYHSRTFHNANLCWPDCDKEKQKQQQQRWQQQQEEEEEEEEFGVFAPRAASGELGGAEDFGAEEEEMQQESREEEEIRLVNERYNACMADAAAAAAAAVAADEDQDDLKVEYAAALSRVFPESLVITWQVITDCDIYHSQDRVPDPSRWNLDLRKGKGKGKGKKPQYSSVAALLKTRYGQDALSGTPFGKTFASQEELVARILAGGHQSQGNPDGGFVTIEGGFEGATDLLSKNQFGFCFQKSPVTAQHMGPFSHMQAEMLATQQLTREGGGRLAAAAVAAVAAANTEEEKAAAAQLVATAATEELETRKNKIIQAQTRMIRTHGANAFVGSTETLSLGLFVFLLLERKLTNFKILHFLHFEHRQYLTPFIEDKLQRRHELRLATGDVALERGILKLVLNGK
jgi:hypothetical protein